MSDVKNFSPNMLKTFEECEQKFYLKYVKRLSLPQRAKIFEKGKKIHALANYYLQGENIEKMEMTLNPNEKSTWELLKNNKYFKLKAINTEYNISCKIGEKNWIGGRLDAFMHNSDEYLILDYKTGQIPKDAETNFQTIVYLLCVNKLLKGQYKSLKFVYLGLKPDTAKTDSASNEGVILEKTIELTPENRKIFEEKIIATCKKINFAINEAVFAKCKNCQNCEFNKICNN